MAGVVQLRQSAVRCSGGDGSPAQGAADVCDTPSALTLMLFSTDARLNHSPLCLRTDCFCSVMSRRFGALMSGKIILHNQKIEVSVRSTFVKEILYQQRSTRLHYIRRYGTVRGPPSALPGVYMESLGTESRPPNPSVRLHRKPQVGRAASSKTPPSPRGKRTGRAAVTLNKSGNVEGWGRLLAADVGRF